MINTIRGFWQYTTNGAIYAVECDTFGKIIGGAGPLDPNDLRALNSYVYKPAITSWLTDAVSSRQLRRLTAASRH
jgi:hypothetical protein